MATGVTMDKIFKAQKTMMVVFIATAIVVFVFSLYFMTDFKDLFGLQLKANKPIMEFHDITMQSFNQTLFWFAIFGMVTVVCLFFLETGGKVPDLFALVFEGVCLLSLAGFSLYVLMYLPQLEEQYLNLDFSKYKLEGGADYILSTATFTGGLVLHLLNILVCLGFLAVLVSSHVAYVQGKKKEALG